MNVYDAPTGPNDACAHKQTTHWHGTHACYVLDRCHCPPCQTANTEYEAHRRRWLGEFPREQPPLVDADQARAIVRTLQHRGIGLKTISTRSDVPHGVIWKLMYGKNGRPSRKVRRTTVTRLEAYAQTAEPADCARVDAAEAWLIIDELVARGWSRAAIGRRVHGPQAKSLQLRSTLIEYGHLKTLRELLDDPVPLRSYGRHGPRPVGTDHRWRTLDELTGETRPVELEERDLVGRRLLCCRACGRPLVDHRLTERCA